MSGRCGELAELGNVCDVWVVELKDEVVVVVVMFWLGESIFSSKT